MTKKIIIIIICVALICTLLFSTMILKKDNQNIKEISNIEKYKYSFNCNEIENIIDIEDDFSGFYTSNGDYYNISLDKIFSNEKNCIINTSKKYNKLTSFEGEKKADNEWERVKLYIDGEKVLSENNEIKFEKQQDENVEYITNSTIKTNKRIYVYGPRTINSEECNKYADIECIEQYKFYENNSLFYKEGDDSLNKYINKIKFYKTYGAFTFFILKDDEDHVYTDIGDM